MRRETILAADGSVQMDRLRIVACQRFGLYLHRIHQADDGRDPHDHAWPFVSLMLRGGYVERVHTDPTFRVYAQKVARHRWSVHRMGTDRAHRIIAVRPGTVTLVLRGWRGEDPWCFWTARGRVPHGEYLRAGERV
jgi:hypothetical protein